MSCERDHVRLEWGRTPPREEGAQRQSKCDANLTVNRKEILGSVGISEVKHGRGSGQEEVQTPWSGRVFLKPFRVARGWAGVEFQSGGVPEGFWIDQPLLLTEEVKRLMLMLLTVPISGP